MFPASSPRKRTEKKVVRAVVVVMMVVVDEDACICEDPCPSEIAQAD